MYYLTHLYATLEASHVSFVLPHCEVDNCRGNQNKKKSNPRRANCPFLFFLLISSLKVLLQSTTIPHLNCKT